MTRWKKSFWNWGIEVEQQIGERLVAMFSPDSSDAVFKEAHMVPYSLHPYRQTITAISATIIQCSSFHQ